MSRATKLNISPAIKERWYINNSNILDSKSKAGGCFVFKFCYYPDTGEFLCDVTPFCHQEIIEKYGKQQFDDYVRGIYFREKGIVYLRQHFEEEYLIQTRSFLRKYGVKSNIRIIWGVDAARELAYDLRGL